ncbi:retrovirus-related pol polyprotein from transposon TNT 1-94 [Tanacetum coccineum]
MWIIVRGDEGLILWWGIEYLEICMEHKFSTPGKLIQKLLLNQKCMGYLVHAYYSISPTSYYKDDSCWSADLKSKATEDIISIGSFVEVLVINQYVFVRKILFNDKPPDLSYLHVFGALCYPTNDSENLGKLQPKADIGIFIGYAPTKKAFRIYNRRTRRIIETIHVDFDELTAMASEHSSSGPALHDMTPVTISSGLVPNPPPSTPFVPPSRSDWDLLFQPMFDESLNPPPYVDLQAPEVIAPIPEVVAPKHAVSTGSPSSTTVDQDAPSPSNSHTTQETQTPIISHDVEEDNHDIEVAHMGNDPYFGILIPEVTSDQSSSSDVIHTIVPPDLQSSATQLANGLRITHLRI